MSVAVFEAIILGIVQGLTEFFPVSSSGHLVILQGLFGLKEPQLAFDVFLHVGTLAAVLVYFRHDIRWLFGKNRKDLVYIITASIPTFLIGFLFKDAVERFFGMPKVVGYMMLVTGLALIATTVYTRLNKHAGGKKQSVANSVVIGVAQGIAVMPGISRSGATLSAGILSGLNHHTAFRFSFLLSVPAILGATGLKAVKIGQSLAAGDAVSFIAGALTAMVVGLFAIDVLLRLVKDNKLYLFGIYCILAGAAVIILL